MIHLVTDTTAYLPSAFLERWPIHTVPLKVTFGDQSIDEDQVSSETFFERLARVETAPSTSQPSPGEFMRLYQQLLKNGDEIISLHISSGLSGTSLVAEMAANEVAPDRITVIDSRSATCGLALMLQQVARLVEAGGAREDAVRLVETMREKYAGIFLVETLDYLAKGGRINGAAKLLGNMLHLRPILHLNDGKIDSLSVARTRKRGIQQVMDEMHKRVGDGPVNVGITHIQCPEDAQALSAAVQARFECADVFIHETGPVIGSHVGPGFIGFAACPVAA